MFLEFLDFQVFGAENGNFWAFKKTILKTQEFFELHLDGGNQSLDSGTVVVWKTKQNRKNNTFGILGLTRLMH